MKINRYLAAGILFFLIAFLGAVLFSGTYTYSHSFPRVNSIEQLNVITNGEGEIFEITEQKFEEHVITLKIHALNRGKGSVQVLDESSSGSYSSVIVHSFGIMTVNGFFGRYTGDILIPICSFLYTLYCFINLSRQYRIQVNKHFFEYRNISLLGLLIFLGVMLLDQLWVFAFNYQGIEDSIESFMNAASTFSFYTLPITFVVSILVTISNIKLRKNEGKNWQNLLGVILGICLLAGTIFPFLLGEWLQWYSNIDVHNQGAFPFYGERFVENSISIITAYLECLLVATVIFGFRAARNIPRFNKDAIMILGCQIMPDGSLTPLLKGRADRALEFARMQKKANGKDIYFIPSGGKGDDEVIAEGEAIGRYLLTQGISEDRIIIENRSLNTNENFRYSHQLALDKFEREPVLAFSTTNYHVLRSGLIAAEQNIDADGIGATTKSYFWVNAFIREFVATIFSERKQHVIVISILHVLLIIMLVLLYISINR